MRTRMLASALAFALMATASFAANPDVGGAPMLETRNIVENAVNSADHTTLVAAVTAAGLAETLMSPGPFTVFAPTNAAFAALPAGTVETLLKPESKDTLVKVLTSHVVAGTITAQTIRDRADRKGFVHLTAVSGDAISLRVRGDKFYVYDESKGVAEITIADVIQSNGVIHVINKVLLPK